MCDSGKDETKLKFAQIYMDGIPGYCVPFDQIGPCLQAELECCEAGDGFEVKVIEMTQEQHDNAPEFEGW